VSKLITTVGVAALMSKLITVTAFMWHRYRVAFVFLDSVRGDNPIADRPHITNLGIRALAVSRVITEEGFASPVIFDLSGLDGAVPVDHSGDIFHKIGVGECSRPHLFKRTLGPSGSHGGGDNLDLKHLEMVVRGSGPRDIQHDV
jgi:hypothetical protein